MAAAKAEMLSGFGPSCADLPLAADVELSENSRQGFERKNAALHLGQEVCNSTTALGIERGLLGNCVGSRIQSWNRYAYVLNNPLSSVDPTGLDCVYLNDSGSDIESIDQSSNTKECGSHGGLWVDGGLVNYSINGDQVQLWGATTTGLGANGNTYAQYQTQAVGLTPFQSFLQGWGTNTGFLRGFLTGTGQRNQLYLPGNVQTASFLNSKVANQMMEKVLEGCGQSSSGSNFVSTSQAATNAFTFAGGAPDVLASPTAFQLGAFTYDWQISGGTVNFAVQNPATLNSFLYHAPAQVGIGNPASGPLGTINQTLNFSLDLPFYAQCGG